MSQRRPAGAVSSSPRPLGDEGDAFVAKRRKNALGDEVT